MNNKRKPKWVPDNAGEEFATSMLKGKLSKNDMLKKEKGSIKANSEHQKRKKLNLDDYINGVLSKDRTILARAITLMESNSQKHISMAQNFLKGILPETGNSIRIGVTGAPGSGKSTFIETLGCYLCQRDHKLAVLAVDPSSSLSKGSVLGDKTRMEKLAREENCFIRPSPTGGVLGGINRKTRETMLACEAAGYDIIMIETVGVGQNEIAVRSLVDFFLLLKIPGAGDELQSIKKGIMELADAIIINKSDGDNVSKAKLAKAEFSRSLHYLKSTTPDWNPKVVTASSLYNMGIAEIWDMIMDFKEITQKNGFFQKRRNQQMKDWIHFIIREYLETKFYDNKAVRRNLSEIEQQVIEGKLPPTTAAQKLISKFESNVKESKDN